MKKLFFITLISLILLSIGCQSTTSDQQGENVNPIFGAASGNISNGGLMCGGDDGLVYYRSEADSWHLYKASPDGSNRKKISSDIPCDINVLDGWVYYSNHLDGYRLYKIRTDSANRTKLTDTAVLNVNVVGDTVYYVNKDNPDEQNCLLPYKMRTDGSQTTKLGQFACHGLITDGRWLFFVGNIDGKGLSIYRMNTDGGELKKLNNLYSHFLNVDNGYLFYWSVDENKLRRMKIDGSEDKVLVDAGVDYVNVSNGYGYFLKQNDGYNIYRVKTTGGDMQKLTRLPADQPELPSFMPNSIYVVGDHIYYRGYHAEKGDALFRVPTDGSGQDVWDYRG